jgi:hypothetical protein
LHHFHTSSSMLWPCELIELETCNYTMVEFTTESEPFLKPIFDIAAMVVKAATFEWKCWQWQAKVLPVGCVQKLKPGIRAFVSSIKPFVEVAAEAAWWKLSRTLVASYAMRFHLVVEPAASLFDLLWAFLKQKTTASDDEALRIIYTRLTKEQVSSVAETLLQMDEALEVLDAQDVKLVTAEQKAIIEAKARHNTFQAEYVARAKMVAAAKPKAKAKAKAKAAMAPGPPVRTYEHHITQAEAKLLLPPGASVWRGVSRGEWNSHLPPARRNTESFHKHGSSALALKIALQKVWHTHLLQLGLNDTECPIVNLFSA